MKCSKCSVVRFTLNAGLCETCSFEERFPNGRPVHVQRSKAKRKKKEKFLYIKESRRKQLQLHGVKTYAEYLQTPHWRAMRKRILDADGYKCQACFSKEHLHVHHKTYENLGREADNDLVTLCEPCHDSLHKKHEHIKDQRKGNRRRFKSLWKATDVFISKKRRAIKREQKREAKRKAKDLIHITMSGGVKGDWNVEEVGDKCRVCRTKVVIKVRNKPLTRKQLKRTYNYKQWLKCPTCRRSYYKPEWKMTEKERVTWGK